MGTVDTSLVLHGLINHKLDKSKQLYCALTDFSKDVDHVDKNSVWLKLIKLGIRSKMLDIVRSMYSTVRSRAKLFNNLSNSFE